MGRHRRFADVMFIAEHYKFASKPEMTLLSGLFAGILTIMNQGVENCRLESQ